MHQFGPEMKRIHPIMFFGHNSDVWVHFGRFRYCDGNHAGVAFNAPIQAENETMHRFGPEMKRTQQSCFLDPIVMFWFILVGFVTVMETMPGLHSMHRFGPKTKRCTDSGQI